MKYIKIILFILSVIVTVTFILSNSDLVAIDLFPLPFKIYTPLFIIVIFSFICGMFCSSVRSFFITHSKKREGKADKQKIRALENEIEGMKTDIKIKASI